MTTPMTREQKIELMRTAKERIEARVARLQKDPAVRNSMRKPALSRDSGTVRSKRSIKIEVD